MPVILREEFKKEDILMRDVYARTLVGLAAGDKRIVALDSDLMGSSGMKSFAEAYPDRFFNVGIAEGNMVGVAGGLSSLGYIPFAHSFGAFAARRTTDQVFVAAYARLNVRIVGTDPGVTAAFNGGTHMPFEDMAVLRAIPGMTLIEPTDTVMLEQILRTLVDYNGMVYLRLQRKNPIGVYAPGSKFELGKGITIRDGKDLTIVCSGIMTGEALSAARRLADEGISARVVNMFTWKPIDGQLLEKCAAETGAIVTAENHNVFGGLGGAVCESVCRTCPVPVEMVGVEDRFGEVGTEDFLKGKYGLNADTIIRVAKNVLKRKV